MKKLFQIATESKKLPSIALENEVADGKSHIEMEYVIYGRITNWEGLAKADHMETQEQYEVKIPKSPENHCPGKIRIRKTIDNGVTSYKQTTKTDIPNAGTDIKQQTEITILTSEDGFNQFKLIATSGILKKRYIFKIPDSELKWEVDVIQNNGKSEEWVKIDLECSEEMDELPPLPELGLVDIITNQANSRTVEENQKIQELYSTVFLKKPDITIT